MDANRVVQVFNSLFAASHGTRLVGEASEPYFEASEQGFSTIYFCHDYASSALHEVAHWCIAGHKRRKQNDYGYWYRDDRGPNGQQAFERVEAQPQALEWIFSKALGVQFQVSADNLELPEYDLTPFKIQVRRALEIQLERGLAPRAARFAAALSCLGQNPGYDRIESYPPLPN